MMSDMDSTNKETIFDELNNFEKKKLQVITPVLDEYLGIIAKTGNTIFPWAKLRPVFRYKMDKVITEFNVAYPANDIQQSANLDKFDFLDLHGRLLKAVDEFTGTPFTIQRLCELIISPYKQYKRADKFMRALEKDLLVVSTIDPVININQSDGDHSALMNGVTVSSTSLNGAVENPNHSSTLSDEGSSNTTDQGSSSSFQIVSDENPKVIELPNNDAMQSSLNEDNYSAVVETVESDRTDEVQVQDYDMSTKLHDDVIQANCVNTDDETLRHSKVADVSDLVKEAAVIMEETLPSSSLLSSSEEQPVPDADVPVAGAVLPEDVGGSSVDPFKESVSILDLPTESELQSKTVSSAETTEAIVECPTDEDNPGINVLDDVDSTDRSTTNTTTAVAAAAAACAETETTMSIVGEVPSHDDSEMIVFADAENQDATPATPAMSTTPPLPTTTTPTASTEDEVSEEIEQMEQE